MPRRASPGTRPIENDPLYGSKLVQQVINKVMVDGKKSTAEKIVYDALDILSKRTNTEPVPALEESIKVLTPVLERADRDREVCYLETPFPDTRAFYRKLRFDETAELRPAVGAPPIWTMTRQPVAG